MFEWKIEKKKKDKVYVLEFTNKLQLIHKTQIMFNVYIFFKVMFNMICKSILFCAINAVNFFFSSCKSGKMSVCIHIDKWNKWVSLNLS